VVNAQTGAVVSTEAAGQDHGGPGGKHGGRPQAPSNSSTPTTQP
jgi:hypothetical protein